jgi:hypothetical protein
MKVLDPCVDIRGMDNNEVLGGRPHSSAAAIVREDCRRPHEDARHDGRRWFRPETKADGQHGRRCQRIRRQQC